MNMKREIERIYFRMRGERGGRQQEREENIHNALTKTIQSKKNIVAAHTCTHARTHTHTQTHTALSIAASCAFSPVCTSALHDDHMLCRFYSFHLIFFCFPLQILVLAMRSVNVIRKYRVK